jgi:hypothetical protein
MSQPKFWKLKREAKRLWQQFLKMPTNLRDDLFKNKEFEKRHAAEIKVTKGVHSISSEVAIYLIFPSNGVTQSHLATLQQMVEEGIAPFIISNVPLSDQDRDMLTKHSWRIMERPNVGYDFGGYRDGVLFLLQYLPELQRLYILNDSAWIIDAPQTWFHQVRALNVDFCGATSSYEVKRVDIQKFREVEWILTPNHRNHHYASYALAFGPKVLQDDIFISFWLRYKLSDDKKRVVRRGEIGLSQTVLSRNFTHATTCPVHNLDEEIAALDKRELDRVARLLILSGYPKLHELRCNILKSDFTSERGREDRIYLILTAVTLQAIGYALPAYTIPKRGFQFVKKSPIWLTLEGSDATLAVLETLDGPLAQTALQEARELRASKGKHLEAR